MNTEKMNPRHRKQAATLAACMFEVMTEPTEWRMIVELHTIPEEYKNDPDPLRHYYMIDAAYFDGDNFDELTEIPGGVWSVCGDMATDARHTHTTHDAHPQAVAKWLLQMINRDRVRRIWVESY